MAGVDDHIASIKKEIEECKAKILSGALGEEGQEQLTKLKKKLAQVRRDRYPKDVYNRTYYKKKRVTRLVAQRAEWQKVEPTWKLAPRGRTAAEYVSYLDHKINLLKNE